MIDPLQPVVKKDLSMTTTKATLLSFVFGLPIACLLMGLYLWRWGAIISLNNTRPISYLVFFIGFLTTLILGIVIHELIHGLAWAIAGHKPLSAIKFGFQWQALTLRALSPTAGSESLSPRGEHAADRAGHPAILDRHCYRQWPERVLRLYLYPGCQWRHAGFVVNSGREQGSACAGPSDAGWVLPHRNAGRMRLVLQFYL